MTIKTIIAALVTLIGGWQQNNSLKNDIADAMLALGAAHELGVQGSAFDMAYKIVGQASAGVSNLESGQAATVAKSQGYTLVMVKDGGAAAKSLGL